MESSGQKLERILELWNYALTHGAANVLGEGAPYIFLEVGRVALEKLRAEGVELVAEDPVETINAVYGYFVLHGYMERAEAKLVPGKKTDQGWDVVEIHEKWSMDFHNCCWAILNDELCAHACFCYNLMRYALFSKFGLDLEFMESGYNHATGELDITAGLVPASKEVMKTASLLDEINSHRAGSRDYKRAVEMSLDPVVSINESGNITLWNPAAERVFGYGEDEVIGRTVEVIIPPECRERHRRGMKRFIETGESRLAGNVTELEAVKKNGEMFPVELSLSAERSASRWVFTAVLRDISTRRTLEEELRRRLVEMERLNKLMVGRELKMEELREEIRELRSKLAEQRRPA